MERIKTGDGSFTLFSERYNEHYHSITGALEETYRKFIGPCRIAEKSLSKSLRILDIGFGLGYNAIAAIDTALKSNPACEVEIISLEQQLIIDTALGQGLDHYWIIGRLSHDPANNAYSYEEKNISLRILIGDARQTIKRVRGTFDAVFLDPFSPKKNPELWTENFLSDVRSRMREGAILATYSCARSVRDNLKKSGLSVTDGPKVGRRGPSTVAFLNKN